MSGQTKPPKAFVSDGCSGFMSFLWQILFHTTPPWEGCCLEHDQAYWQGGPLRLRLEADTKLMQGVAAKGHPYWAVLMFIAVRLGGLWWVPFPSVRRINGRWHFSFDGVRWGYGHHYPHYQ